MQTTVNSGRFDFLTLVPDAIVVSDAEYRVCFWNRAAERLYGIPAADAMGRKIDELVDVISDVISRATLRERVTDEGAWRGQVRHATRGGAPFWVDWSVSRCELDEGKSGFLAITRDISDQKRAEEEQKRQAAFLRTILDSSEDLIFVKDTDLRTVLCNKAFARAFGKTEEMFIGKTDLENGFPEKLVKGDPERGINGYEDDDRRVLGGRRCTFPARSRTTESSGASSIP